MAQHKYLTYEGLKALVQRVASVITGTVSDAGITLYLHGKTTDSSGKVINGAAISNVVIPIAGATQSNGEKAASGLITAAELERLGGMEDNAEENQFAFSNVNITNNNGGSTALTIAADEKTDTLNLTAGSNIKITGDATNKKVTIANTYKYTHAKPGAKDSDNLNDQSPKFGAKANYIKQVTSNDEGHVTAIETGTITIPALPNVTVTGKGDTAANASTLGNTVKVIETVSNGSYPSSVSDEQKNNNIYLDYTTVEVPTKKYVDSLVTTSEAVVLKGTTAELIASTGNLSKGDTYICAAALSNNAKLGTLEKGDVVIYNNATAKTYNNSTSADWIVIQANANVYNGSYGFVPNKTNSTASASYFLNEKGSWAIPAKRGITVNNTPVFGTSASGTVNFVNTENVLISVGTQDSNGIPISFDIDTEKVSLVGHKHTITANEQGDKWINVVGEGGDNAVTYTVTHKDPDTDATNVYSAADGSELTMGTSDVVTGVKYDDKGHIIGVTSGKLPSDSKGVTKITPGTGLRNGNVKTAITSSGTLNLIAATDSEIGGIKITAKNNVTVDDVNRFGVKINNSNVAYVEILEISTAEINGLFS